MPDTTAIQFKTETDPSPHADFYKNAIKAERQAEVNSIVAAWETGHAFRTYDDPVHTISEMTGMSESYIGKRIRLAGAYTKVQLLNAIERSGCTHFTAFHSWSFGDGNHEANQMFPHRNVHVPATHYAYFEGIGVDVSELLKEFLAVVPPAELHAILRTHVQADT
jgi:hypothetical protein